MFRHPKSRWVGPEPGESMCIVCGCYVADPRMCKSCCRSYDRSLAKGATVLAAIVWAANRARWGREQADRLVALFDADKEEARNRRREARGG